MAETELGEIRRWNEGRSKIGREEVSDMSDASVREEREKGRRSDLPHEISYEFANTNLRTFRRTPWDLVVTGSSEVSSTRLSRRR